MLRITVVKGRRQGRVACWSPGIRFCNEIFFPLQFLTPLAGNLQVTETKNNWGEEGRLSHRPSPPLPPIFSSAVLEAFS